jgi:hypothetical protein
MLRTWRPARFEALAKRGRVHWVQDLFDGRQLEPRRKQKCSTARPYTKFLTLPVMGIIARIEVGAEGAGNRFIVTALCCWQGQGSLGGSLLPARRRHEPHHVIEDTSCRRPTACTIAAANRSQLFFHADASRLMWDLRASMAKRSSFAVVPFDALRLHLIKIACADGRNGGADTPAGLPVIPDPQTSPSYASS